MSSDHFICYFVASSFVAAVRMAIEYPRAHASVRRHPHPIVVLKLAAVVYGDAAKDVAEQVAVSVLQCV